MKVIGVTGGVGCGKSEILNYLEGNYSCRILKADDAARELELPGGAVYPELVSLLRQYPCAPAGEEAPAILLDDGRINNPEMARRIFQNGILLRKVNNIVHPAVKTYIMDEIEKERNAGRIRYFFVEAALLIECGYQDILDSLWYIYCDLTERRRRLKASRGYSDGKIDGIFRSQLSEEEFRAHADVVIDNSGRIEDSCRQVDAALAEAGSE